MSDVDPVLTAREVADELHISYDTVLRAVRRGDLRAAKRGRLLYIRRSAVDAFLDPDAAPGSAA